MCLQVFVVYLSCLKLLYIFEQICQFAVMCGATTTNDAIKAFRYAQQRHLTHYGLKSVLILPKFLHPNWQRQLMFRASLMNTYSTVRFLHRTTPE